MQDDDIVYIADGALEDLVREKSKSEFQILSANVVNHALLSHVHARRGAISPFVQGSDYFSSQWNDSEYKTLDIDWKTSKLPLEFLESAILPDKTSGDAWNQLVGAKHRWHRVDYSETTRPDALTNLGYRYGYSTYDGCSWHSWRCATLAHYSFFKNMEEGQLPNVVVLTL